MPPRLLILDEPARHAELYGGALDLLGAERIDGGALSPEDALAARPDAVLLSREWTPGWRLIAAAARRAGLPVIYVMDGVIEWSYVWNNLGHIRPSGAFLQPVFASDLCVIGAHPARVFSSWGLADRLHVVGLPRLDGYDRSRRIEAGRAPRLLITTARTAGHDPEQQVMTRRALRDLKTFLDAHPTIRPTWRIAADLAEDIGVRPDTAGSLAQALSATDALITTPSTCLLEAMLKGVPVAQLDYRPAPLYTSSAWEIRSAEHLAPVVAELLAPPPAKLAWQDACLGDELAAGDASARLTAVIRDAIARASAAPVEVGTNATPAPAETPVAGRLDFRQIHSELSLFSAAPAATLAYELDAAHRLLRQAREQRVSAVREASELVEAAFGSELAALRVFPLIDHLGEAEVRRERHGSVSAGTTTLDGHTRRTLFFSAPALAGWVLPKGEPGLLALALSTHPDTWENPGTGPCRFVARLNGQPLVDVTLDPRADPGQRRWHWFNLPIPAHPDGVTQRHILVLEVTGVNGEAFRWALWRNPVVIWTSDPALSPDAHAPLAARQPDYYVPGRTVV
jgi:hypothetical protein